jgi:lysophospholipase L1-like esterase
MILVIGDSLGVGTRPYLPSIVHEHVLDDSRGGRTSSQGVAILRRHRWHPRVVVFALGTNDWSLSVLRRNLRTARRLSRPACFITVSITKPGPDLNRALRGYRVVRWRRYTRRHHVLGPDHVHATAAGYRARARLIAREVKRCG